MTAGTDSDVEPAEVLAGAVEAFDAMSQSTTVTPRDLDVLRSLATVVDSIRTEQASRREAAEQAAAEIDALAAQVRGGDPEPAEETAAAEPEPESAPRTTVSAAAVQRPALDLSTSAAASPASSRNRRPRHHHHRGGGRPRLHSRRRPALRGHHHRHHQPRERAQDGRRRRGPR
ncbi:hypothetical protein [Streptomyces sp. URMC 123]|uniref:hypothetical protein n=1 Tax=Streptomyces sp. URMC 123 TaxID=3423403 RepID=UPI003F1C7FAE